VKFSQEMGHAVQNKSLLIHFRIRSAYRRIWAWLSNQALRWLSGDHPICPPSSREKVDVSEVMMIFPIQPWKSQTFETSTNPAFQIENKNVRIFEIMKEKRNVIMRRGFAMNENGSDICFYGFSQSHCVNNSHFPEKRIQSLIVFRFHMIMAHLEWATIEIWSHSDQD
jgi:hypothetical protein